MTFLSKYIPIRRTDMTGSCWLHKTKPVWINEYHAQIEKSHYFQAYRATAEVPDGRRPWETPSTYVGDAKRGFRSLEAAAKAGDESC